MVKRIVIAICILLCASFATAQYSASYQQSVKDFTSYAISGTNAWVSLNGGTCLGVSVSYDGVLWCINTGYGVSTFNQSTQSWTAQTALGTGIQAVAAEDTNDVWVLKSTPSCDSLDYGVFKWNGSSLTQMNGCVVQLSVGTDGTLMATTYYQQIFQSLDGGNTWTAPWGSGTAWSYVSEASQYSACAVQGRYIYTLVSGTFTLMPIPQQPWGGGSVIGCVDADNGDPILLAWNTSGAVAMYDYTNSVWHAIPGLTINTNSVRAGYLSAPSKSEVIGLPSNGQPYHWNVYAPYIYGAMTGSWNGCPGPGNICPIGTTHTGTMQVYYPHGLNGSQGTWTGAPTDNMNANSWDTSASCDLIFGDPSSPECVVHAGGQAKCNVTQTILATAPQPPAFPCIANLVPPRTIGWHSVSAVTVYVSNHWNAAEQSDICAGISNWHVFNLNSYTCISASSPPAQSYSGKYIWVSYDSTYVDILGHPRATNFPCGYWFYHGYGSTECPAKGANLKHPWIVMGPYSDAQLTGVGAHEEGHDNWLNDCYNCQHGGSVMGSQGTWESSQPTAPTVCDIFWAGVWSVI